jgi:phosphoribosylanthranilate isomerase
MVKICGITSAADARFALSAGADWIGLNLVGGPRKIALAACLHILRKLDNPSCAVVLVGTERGVVAEPLLSTIHECGVRRVQLYGDRSADSLRRLSEAGFEVVFVHHIADEKSLPALGEIIASLQAHRPAYVLLDTAVSGIEGGTGRIVDWNAIREFREANGMRGWPPVLLAGGLTAENVGEAVRITRCAGVDVSSGVETAPGLKDVAKVAGFIRSAREALQGVDRPGP